ncbi:ecotropic viral integration site 2B [Genypterus blacodes]|uniref:ecotropic viral integration site 2B n=1 Tax=Genypterus blacodes TaxID=154954 RepID=UPI003F75D956
MDTRRFLSMLLSLIASGSVTLGQSLNEDPHPTLTKRLLEIQTTPVMSLVSASRGRNEATPPPQVSGNTPRDNENWPIEQIVENTSGPVQASSQPADSQTASSKVSLSAATASIDQTANSTTQATSAPPLASTISERQDKRSNSITTNDKTLTSPSLSSTPPTNPSTLHSPSNDKISTKPPENNSTNTGQVTGGAATVKTSSYKTSMTTTKMWSIPTAKKSPPNSGHDKNSYKGENHGKVVTWIIGGALVFLIVGILVIYVKKQKIKKEQVATKDWAGPSPFLEGGAGSDGQVELRSSNRISLSSFLPMRLSRRLSMLQETEEELEDINNTTFGDKHEANNGTAVGIPADKVTGSAQKTKTGPTSSQTNDLMSKNDHTPSVSTDVGKLTEDNSANTPSPSEAANSIPPSQLDDASDKLQSPTQPT